MSTSQEPGARRDGAPHPCPFARSATGPQGGVLLEPGFDCPRLRAPDGFVHAYADRVPASAGVGAGPALRGGATGVLAEDEAPGTAPVFALEDAGVAVAECAPGTGGCRG